MPKERPKWSAFARLLAQLLTSLCLPCIADVCFYEATGCLWCECLSIFGVDDA